MDRSADGLINFSLLINFSIYSCRIRIAGAESAIPGESFGFEVFER